MSQFVTHFINSIERNMPDYPKDVWLPVGVSGGADSTALLLALKSLGYKVMALHCNFHLRGEESDHDMDFVSRLCAKNGIPLETTDFNVTAYRKNHPCSVETACRDLRYEWFFRMLDKLSCPRIAIAHNADDNIETILLNLLRGTGLRGIKGMERDNGKVLRPMLSLYRKDIEKYLAELEQHFITDSTNLESDYRRNFLRNEVLPLIRTRWPDADKAITLSIANFNSEWHLLDEVLSRRRTEGSLPLKEILDSPSPTATVYHFISPSGGSAALAEEISKVVESGVKERKFWQTRQCRIVLERNSLNILPNKPVSSVSWDCTAIDATPQSLKEIRRNPDQGVFFTSQPLEKYRMRVWKPGDRIEPLGMKGSSLVSDIIKDAKLTVAEKEQVMVAERLDDNRIVWVEGLKRSRHDLVDGDCQRFFRISRIKTDLLENS